MSDLLNALDIEAKRFADVLIEEKVVRHVRTPAGVARFKQPIGSVITNKGGLLKHIEEIASEFDGWDKYKTKHGDFYVGREDSDWIVTDRDDNDLVSKSNEEDALEWLDDYVGSLGAGTTAKRQTNASTNDLGVPTNLGAYDPVSKTFKNSKRPTRLESQPYKKAGTTPSGDPVVSYNGEEYSVQAKGGVTASVTVTRLSDGKSVEVAGGSTTGLARERSTDREYAIREGLTHLDATKKTVATPTGDQTPEQRAEYDRIGGTLQRAYRKERENGASHDEAIAKVAPNLRKPDSLPEATQEDLDHLFGKTPVSMSPNTPATRPVRRPAASKPASRPQTAKTPEKPAGKRAATSGGGVPGYTSPSNLSPDREARLGVLTPAPSEYDGWEKFEDGHVVRYLGKVDGKWVVNDENDNTLFEGTNKVAVRKEMQNAHASFDDGSPVRQFPRKVTRGQHAKKPREDTIRINNLEHAESEQQIRAHAAAYGYAIPADAKNVMLNMNPDDPESRIYAWYVQGKGAKPQLRQKPETAEANANNKWARIQAFDHDVKSIDSKIASTDLSKDDDMMVVALMRKYGARIGSNKSAREKDDGEPRGMSELSRKDVSIEGDTVILDYPGKKYNAKTGAGWQHYEIDDPQLVDAFKKRYAKMNKDSDLFFPAVTATSTKDLTRRITGGEYTNHDFRRRFATDQAAALVKLRRPQPKTKAEVEEAIKGIGAFVDDLLNDKNQALKSYIDPRVFEQWNKIGA